MTRKEAKGPFVAVSDEGKVIGEQHETEVQAAKHAFWKLGPWKHVSIKSVNCIEKESEIK